MSNYIALPNSAAEVTPTGRIVRNGLRFKPAGTSASGAATQPVLNITVEFKRGYLPKNGDPKNPKEWVNVKQYFDFALWGDRATQLANTLAKIQDNWAALPETHEIRVKVAYSNADLNVRPWTDKTGQARYSLEARCATVELVSVNASNFNGQGAPAAEQMAEGEMISAPDEEVEVPLL